VDWLVELVTSIRSLRTEMNVPARAQAQLVVLGADDDMQVRFGRHDISLGRLARIERVEFAQTPPSQCAQMVVGELTICLPLGNLIDVGAERARLTKECEKLVDEKDKIQARLGNEKFVANAREEVVTQARERVAELEEHWLKLRRALDRLC